MNVNGVEMMVVMMKKPPMIFVVVWMMPSASSPSRGEVSAFSGVSGRLISDPLAQG